jgi:tetratricopeptide (TPR) repeat protein
VKPEVPAPAPEPDPAAEDAAEILKRSERAYTLEDQQRRAESETYYRLGLAYRDKGDFQSAKECAEKAVKLWPSNLEARRLLYEVGEILSD